MDDERARDASGQRADELRDQLGLGAPARRKSWLRRGLWVAGMVMAGVVLTILLGSRAEESSRYLTQPVRQGELVEAVTATGTLRALDTVEVGTEVSGRILEVAVDFNDRVQRGQLLATIDPEQAAARAEEAAAQLQAAQASVTRAEASAREAAQNLSRARQMSEAGLLAAQDLDAAQAADSRASAEVASARAQATVAEASLSSARSSLQKTSIVSPIDGVVLSRAVEPGQTVAASLQTPVLFTLARDLSAMALHVQVDEADVGKVRDGQTATFTIDAYPGRSFDSRVVSLRNVATAEQDVVTYEAVLTVDNEELLLRPGMTATAEIVTALQEDVLLVPNAALRFTPPAVVAAEQGSGSGGLYIPGISQRGRGRGGSGARPSGGAAGAGGGSRGEGGQLSTSTVWVLREGQPTPVAVRVTGSDGRETAVAAGDLGVGDGVIVDVVADEEGQG